MTNKQTKTILGYEQKASLTQTITTFLFDKPIQ